MSDDYIDPNSGRAAQPGGFVAGGASNPIPDPEPTPELDSEADASYEAEQEHSAGPAGEQPGGTSDADGATDAQPEAEGGTEDSSAQAQAEDASDGGSTEEVPETGSEEVPDEGGNERTAGSEEEGEQSGEQDYSELLNQSLGPIQEYIDAHPDEKAAIQAAEIDRAGDDARKGILDY